MFGIIELLGGTGAVILRVCCDPAPGRHGMA